MRIGMRGNIKETKNCKGPWINCIVLLKKNDEITIDRKTTEYTVSNDKFTSTWKECYIWDGEKEIYDEIDISDICQIRIEVEEDVDVDYHISVSEVCVDTENLVRTFNGKQLEII